MLKQGLQQKLLQRLSPQQIQLIKLLEIPVMELEQRIKKELEENPLLEEGESNDELPIQQEPEQSIDVNDNEADKDPDKEEFTIDDYFSDDEYIPSYKLASNNTSADDKNEEIPFSVGDSFQENLEKQLGVRSLSEKQKQIASFLIGNIDDDGYIRRDLESITDDMAFLQNVSVTVLEVEEVLHIIQELDPPGIGARDLRECLLLQLQSKELLYLEVKNAIIIIRDYFEEFIKKHYDKISDKMDLSDQDLKEAIDEIIHLNPKPGSSYSDSKLDVAEVVIPDFSLDYKEGEFLLTLNSKNVPELRINKSYSEMIEGHSGGKDQKNLQQKELLQFVKHKIDSAKWFIDAIKQRQETLMVTMSAILNRQKEFFTDGDDAKLRPMILKDVAEDTGLDISTISRVANSKYVQTHFGNYPLKYFFSEGMQTDSGEEVSTREIKKILMECISNESKKKPLPDDKLAEILNEKGYPVARRTVAKYREQLNIPVARLRKEL